MDSFDSGKAAKDATTGDPDIGRRLGGVSLADVAAEANVSRMTVSRALREAGGVSSETRVRVLDVGAPRRSVRRRRTR